MPHARVLVGVEGGASIDGKSGQLIANELLKIASDISVKKPPKIAFTVNTQLTSQNITNQLDDIVKRIQITPINLNIRMNQPSVGSGNFAEEEYRKLIESTKGNKSKANLIAYIEEIRTLNELNAQKAKDVESTKKQEKAARNYEQRIRSLVPALETINKGMSTQKLNSIEQMIPKFGRFDLSADLQKIKSQRQLIKNEIDKLNAEFNASGNMKSFVQKIINDPQNSKFKNLLKIFKH